jgi:hypothetical protein
MHGLLRKLTIFIASVIVLGSSPLAAYARPEAPSTHAGFGSAASSPVNREHTTIASRGIHLSVLTVIYPLYRLRHQRPCGGAYTAAEIPIKMTVTNSGTQTLQPGGGINPVAGGAGFGVGIGLGNLYYWRNPGKCFGGANYLAMYLLWPGLAPSQSITWTFFLELADYYSNRPNYGSLKRTCLRPVLLLPGGGQPVTYKPALGLSLSGPGFLKGCTYG